ncbi:hypothetical protein ABPG77_005836 [Micractinium sp. CCAP 211/92]
MSPAPEVEAAAAPHAAPADPASQSLEAPQSLYDQLGGQKAVEAAVELFYSKLLDDPELSPFFEGVDMPQQRRKQAKFMSLALGGPGAYTGRGLGAVHRRLVEEKGLRNRHFDLVLGHLGASLAELGVPQDVIAQAAAVVESTRPSFGFPPEDAAAQ